MFLRNFETFDYEKIQKCPSLQNHLNGAII